MSSRWSQAGLAIATLAVAFGLAACGQSDQRSSPEPGAPAAGDPGFGHVHGLGVNPADGVLYAATHYGVWRLPANGRPIRVADRYQDTMGFTIVGPDHFLGSGHPDLRERLPAHLGLIESRDRAETWQSLSLLGEADFHALEAKHGRIYGYDSTSSTFMVSGDGRTWQRRARLGLADITVSPSDPSVVLATAEQGLLHSRDGGETFRAVPGAPRLVFVDWSAAGLYGLDPAGAAWASTDSGETWERRGELGSRPGALTVTDTGQLFAADEEAVVTSRDGGRTFTTVVSYTTAAHR
jgi:photosystem II stability/assembly factor-like uncharacterized protein